MRVHNFYTRNEKKKESVIFAAPAAAPLSKAGAFNACSSITAPSSGVNWEWAVERCSFRRTGPLKRTPPRKTQTVVSMRSLLLSLFCFNSFALFPFQRPLLVLPPTVHVFFLFFRRELRIIGPFFSRSSSASPRWRCFHSCRNL